MKDWTVIMYFAGNNNLREEMLFAVKEMFRVGPIKNVDVVVLFNANGRFRQFTLSTDADAPKISSPNGLDFDLGDKQHLLKNQTTRSEQLKATDLVQRDIVTPFICRTIKKHRAQHYMLVLSGHGTGAIGDFLANERPMDHMTVPGMADMLKAVQKDVDKFDKFDILGLDSCLMSMAEVACEVAPFVHYMVANEGFDPATGWNYGAVLDLMKKTNWLGKPRELAEELLKTYIEYYSDYAYVVDTSVDQSVLDLTPDKVDGFKKTVSTLAGAMRTGLETPAILNAIVLAHWKAQTYKWEQYTDLWDFCDILYKNLAGIENADDIKSSCDELKRIIDGTIPNDESKIDENRLVVFSGWAGPAYQHSHGVSVFFPWARIRDWDGTFDIDRYAKQEPTKLRFAENNNWDQFLARYLDATLKPVREKGAIGPDIKSDFDRRSGIYGIRAGLPDDEKATLSANTRAGLPDDEKAGLPDDEKGALAANITAKLPHMQNLSAEWRRAILARPGKP